MAASDPAGVFPGWWVVAGTFLVLTVGFGIAYSFAAFFSVLSAEFSANRAETALVFSIAALLYFSLGLPAGLVADRIGPRPVVTLGMAILAAGLLLASQATAIWQVYVGYGLGVGVGVGMAYVPSVAAVQHWFVRRRGLASGIAIAGIGVGTLLGAPLAGWLLQSLSWRQVYLLLAAMAGLTLLISLPTIRGPPDRYGLAPDGDRPLASDLQRPINDLDLGAALRSRPFWMLYGATVLVSFGLFVPFVHIVPFCRDIGLGETYGLFLMTLMGVGSTFGRFVFASLGGYLGRRRSLAMMFGGMAAMLLLWAGTDDALILAIFAVSFGSFYGGFVATAPSLTADYFGSRALGAILGALYTCVAIGTFVGPPVTGWIFDVTGSYAGAILAGGGLSAAGMAVVLACPEPRHWRAPASAHPAQHRP